jgi:hypothetical protein
VAELEGGPRALREQGQEGLEPGEVLAQVGWKLEQEHAEPVAE